MTTIDDSDAKTVHGLTYAPDFLDSLPVLQPSTLPQSTNHKPASPASGATPSTSDASSQSQPQLPYTIRALSASQFASLHTKYLTTHAPDSVIFPFLHGLEGDNDQQNAFFATAARMADGSFVPPPNGAPVNLTERELRKADVPRFRGLMWVASDEDEMEEYERAMQGHRLGQLSTTPPATSASNHATLGPGIHPIPTLRPDEAQAIDMEDDEDDDILEDDDDEDDDYSTTSSNSDLDHFTGMPMDVDEHLDLAADADGDYDMMHGGRPVAVGIGRDAVGDGCGCGR